MEAAAGVIVIMGWVHVSVCKVFFWKQQFKVREVGDKQKQQCI